MSLSSLPDIFKHSLTVPIRTGRQGPAFSLHLGSQSPQKYLSSRAGYAPGENNHVALGSSKARAMSSQQVKLKESVLRDFTARRNDGTNTKMRVSFRQQLQFTATGPLKQKAAMSVMNWSNFPYENSRRFNNATIELEDADNLSKKLETLCQEANTLQSTLQNIKESNTQCRNTFVQFCQNTVEELQTFQESFENSLGLCYRTLSSLRRQTNQEVKGNRGEMQKLRGDIRTCTSFTNDLRQKTDEMFRDYVKTASTNEELKGEQMILDFEEISSIRKSSRGATGDISRRTKRNDLLKNMDSNRKSDQLKPTSAKDNKFVLNGKEIDLLNFEDEY